MRDKLSPREQSIYDLLIEGYIQKEIAARLCISKETVKNHITHIYDKIGVRNKVDLVLQHYGLPMRTRDEG